MVRPTALVGCASFPVATSLSVIPRSAVLSRVPPRTKMSTPPRTGISSRLHGVSGSLRGVQDRDSQHGDNLTDARTEVASAMELSALKRGSRGFRVAVLTAGRDVYDRVFPHLVHVW